MNCVVHADTIGNTAYLNNVLLRHTQQISAREMGERGYMLTEAMMVDPLDELRWCHVLIDNKCLNIQCD